MDLTTQTSYVSIIVDALIVLGALLVLRSLVVVRRSGDRYRAMGALGWALVPLLTGCIVGLFAPSSSDIAAKTSDFPVMHYVTKHQEHAAIDSLYHATYVGHSGSGDTYRRSNGSMLYGCSAHYTKHTTSVHLDALTCGQTVVR